MLVIILSFLLILYSIWTWRLRNIRSSDDPPYYRGIYPIIGHTYVLSGGPKGTWNLLADLAKECSEKGGVLRFILGVDMYYAITDPEDALTAANSCINKHFAYGWAKEWLGEGLLTASGPIWKRHRRLILPAFSVHILHEFLGVFNSQSNILVMNLSDKVGKGHFDILPFLTEISVKTICLTVLGTDPLEDEDFMTKYRQAVDKILGLFVLKFYNICLHSDLICKLVGFKKKEDEIIRILNKTRDVIIQKKRDALKNKQSVINDSVYTKGLKYKSLLDLLLELSENNTLSDKEIREEVDTFIAAGYDTTALTVSYTLMNLGTYPETQDKVYEEIQRVFGNTDRDVDKTDLSQLVYTEACLKETLRMYPLGPVTLRYADKDVQLKHYKIRAGSNVCILLNGMNWHSLWGDDADKFRPERWFKLTPEQHNAFGSFSIGKRNCIGKHYALISMKTTLTHILRRYRVTADNKELKFKVDFVTKPVTGCNVVLEQRN